MSPAFIVLTFIIVIVFGVNSENGCASDTRIIIKTFKEIDSDDKNVTLMGKIHYDMEDIFHLLVIDQNITELCENFINIKSELSVLQIIRSNVEEIDAGAFNITSTLTLIKINHNPLAILKKNIFDNIKVKELDLSDNQISRINAEAFDSNTHLQIVKLNNNRLKELNPEWFSNSPNVYKLNMIYNEITMIPKCAFKNMAQNRGLKLRLSANQINEIHPEAFSGHKVITILRLNGNKLTNLPSELFDNCTINHLQVNMNHLECFPDILFNTTIKTLAFVDNISFKCECLKKVRQFSEDNEIKVLYPSIICEDTAKGVNRVFNYNKTFDIPLMPPFH